MSSPNTAKAAAPPAGRAAMFISTASASRNTPTPPPTSPTTTIWARRASSPTSPPPTPPTATTSSPSANATCQQALAAAPPPVNTSHLFTGKERDAESGLDDFDARYYSSGMGRFMSPDWSDVPAPVPYADLTNPQTLNLYAYVKNNPLRDTDPTGHSGDDDIVDHILNFVVSAGVTFISDNLFGAGRPQPKSVEGQLGQAVGDFAAQQSGIAEAEAGTAGLTDSGVMALVPGGQEVAAGDALVSGAAILHGSATATIATVNLA